MLYSLTTAYGGQHVFLLWPYSLLMEANCAKYFMSSHNNYYGITTAPPSGDGITMALPSGDGITMAPPSGDGITMAPPSGDGIIFFMS
jgi:hypothetical protein